MQHLRIAPIVEGDGEVVALPILLRRIAAELMADVALNVIRPWRLNRGYVLPEKSNKLSEALKVSALNLTHHPEPSVVSGILVLMDRDPNSEPTCLLGPQLLLEARPHLPAEINLRCVLADIEFESWFFAAATSLTDYLEFDERQWRESLAQERPKGKGWIKSNFKKGNYRETVDQPRLTAKMDLALCRQNSSSFDKFCRDVMSLA